MQAARAYDKMMLWCELHNAAGVKGGITNFDPSGAPLRLICSALVGPVSVLLGLCQ